MPIRRYKAIKESPVIAATRLQLPVSGTCALFATILIFVLLAKPRASTMNTPCLRSENLIKLLIALSVNTKVIRTLNQEKCMTKLIEVR